VNRIIVLYILFFACIGKITAQESDSVVIVYDTVYTSDTIHQKEEITIIEKQEYVLDLSTGLSLGFGIPFIKTKGDSCVSSRNANSISATIPFSANFKPFIIQSGIMLERFNANLNLQFRKPQWDTLHISVTDTLDKYYVVKNGDTVLRVLTETHDSVSIKKTFNTIHTKAQNTYTFVSIPLLFGYQLDKKSYSFSVSAGVYFSYLAIIGKQNELSKDDGIFKEANISYHRFFISPAVNARLIIPISKVFDISGGINYCFSPKNLYNSKIYNTHFQSISLQISLFYHF